MQKVVNPSAKQFESIEWPDSVDSWLLILSLSYILIPILIFIFGWLKFYVAIVLFLLLAISVYRSFKNANFDLTQVLAFWNQHKTLILFALIIAIVWSGLSGIGGYGYQNYPDHLKNNLLIRDLLFRQWPVTYQIPTTRGLVYYLGPYLLPTLLGKLQIGLYSDGLTAWKVANHVFFLWSLFGVLLTLFWYLRFQKQPSRLYLILFPLLGGLDYLGTLITTAKFPALDAHIEHWPVGVITLGAEHPALWVDSLWVDDCSPWQFTSNTSLLFWVPNQAIVAWLATSIVLYYFFYKHDGRHTGIPVVSTILSSPFVALGLLPIAVIGSIELRFKKLLSVENIVTATSIAAVFSLYFITSFSTGEHGFIWHYVDIVDKWPRLVLFIILEIGAYYLFAAGIKSGDKDNRLLLIGAVVTLLIIPWYFYGDCAAFSSRASIPTLFVIWVFIGRKLIPLKKASIPLLVLLLLGSLTATAEIIRSVRGGESYWGPGHGYSIEVPALDTLPYDLAEVSPWGSKDYFGERQSFFFNQLARAESSETYRTSLLSPTMHITNPTDNAYVYTHVWNDGALVSYLLDDSSYAGKTYDLEWNIGLSIVELRESYITQLSSIDALSENTYLSIGVSFQVTEESFSSQIYEKRYQFNVVNNDQLVVSLPAESWYNPSFPNQPWWTADIDKVILISLGN